MAKAYHYDQQFDTLYYTLGDTSHSYGEEEIDDIVILRDLESDEITGITVLNFLKHYHEIEL